MDGARLWRTLHELAEFGGTEAGGVARVTLTDADRAGRDQFVEWAAAVKCAVHVDWMGNLFARREGTDPDRHPVVFSSHLDSQPIGGKFDGAYGVMVGLEVGLGATAADGSILGEELLRIGYSGPEPCGGRPIGHYLEPHIEQGPIFEAAADTIGIVTGGQGNRWYDVTISGRESHAGTTPMGRRSDAILSAARLIEAADSIARRR